MSRSINARAASNRAYAARSLSGAMGVEFPAEHSDIVDHSTVESWKIRQLGSLQMQG